MAAARKRPIAHLIDFELGIVGINRVQREPQLRHFLLQKLDRGVGQHMGMDVDGSRHAFSRASLRWRGVLCAYLAEASKRPLRAPKPVRARPGLRLAVLYLNSDAVDRLSGSVENPPEWLWRH